MVNTSMSESDESKFYKKSASYWANVPATIDGVLGGYGHISDIDIEGSKSFLNSIFDLDHPPRKNIALDCGAGIGRITKNLLIPYFKKVDMVEPDHKFVEEAKKFIGKDNMKLGDIYKIGLQNFKPEKKYDVIWSQWVLGYLNDYDLIQFFERCKDALEKDGIIIVKENITSDEEMQFDEDDSSVTRPNKLMKEIFKEAKLHVFKEIIEDNFPDDLYPVHLFALRPK